MCLEAGRAPGENWVVERNGWRRCLLKPKKKEADTLTLVTGHTECFLQIKSWREVEPTPPPSSSDKGPLRPLLLQTFRNPWTEPTEGRIEGWVRADLISNSSPPLISCLAFGRLLNLSELHSLI